MYWFPNGWKWPPNGCTFEAFCHQGTTALSVFNQRGFTWCLGSKEKSCIIRWLYTCLLNCSIALTNVSNSRVVVYTLGVRRTPLMFSHSMATLWIL